MKKVFKTAAFLLAMGLMTSTFTACSDDETTVTAEDQLKVNGITATPNTDGTITISGTVTTNTKLKTLAIAKDEDAKDVVVKLNYDQTKDKGDEGKEWTATITSENLKVDGAYFLVVKTKGDKKATSKVSEAFSFNVGAPSNKEKGSYVSFANKTCYLMGTFWDSSTKTPKAEGAETAKKVEIVLKDDQGAFQTASTAIISSEGTTYPGDKGVSFGKANLYSNGGVNTIITNTGVIATYNVAPKSDATVDISGFMVPTDGSIKINIDGYTFSK
jgi:uncharacterized lipoprotein YehR (DUF1307 family)